MANLILPRRRVIQPRSPAAINWNSAFVKASDLRGAWVPGTSSYNVIYNGRAYAIGALSFAAANGGDDLRKGFLVTDLFRTSATAAAWTNWLGIEFSSGTWPNNVERSVLLAGTDGVINQGSFVHDIDTTVDYTSFALPTAGRADQYGLVWDGSISGGASTAYKNGVAGGNLGKTGTFPWNTGNNRNFNIGRAALNIYASYAYVFGPNCRLSFTDLQKALRENPWQIFAPDKRVLYFSSSSASITGNLSATETGNDTAAIAGVVDVVGSAAVTESGSDSANSTGSVAVIGSFSATETGSDGAAATGSVGVSGGMSATESGQDSVSAVGTVAVAGSMAATETGTDSAVATGSTDGGVHGSMAATEAGSDSASAAGSIAVSGSLGATEAASDSGSASGLVNVAGNMAAVESGSDSSGITGNVDVKGSFSAQETGVDSVFANGSILVGEKPARLSIDIFALTALSTAAFVITQINTEAYRVDR